MQFGWIDFSKEDKKNAINIINLMKEKGVLDELGLGAIRQAFANYFFRELQQSRQEQNIFYLFHMNYRIL